MARFQLINKKTGKIDGYSVWLDNIITETGFDDLIVGVIGGIAASSQVTHIQLGTQTQAPLSTQTSLTGEFGGRLAVTPTLVGNGTLQATRTWETNEATEAGSEVGGIGLYGTSTGGSIGNVLTFATSQKTTDQTLSATVQWRFS